ncbi:hypothetical protein [Streptomyces sp. NPDC050759]
MAGKHTVSIPSAIAPEMRGACDDAGIKGLHFHDLRHTGNTR